ncbi:ankyrin repeat domain-containing protein 27-like [Lytechinus variegatus]|uniref:ankyrin repeat domain-containing protein 27-like n=1 Tax=Lytechinus variegatus TaxID=7654 RepID=UPI001BB17BDD|nr:ankyrin repeat domain-containing protein 27-like [Lytechinus variegatus]
MADHEDLEFNPFYKSLQSGYRSQFEDAQAKRFLVCIPQTASLVGVNINSNFLETHLLKPSPMLKDHYISTDKNGSKTIIVDEAFILTTEGFSQPGRIRILSEELGYNKDYKPFKMLIIEKPLEGAVKGRRGSAGLSDEFLTPRTRFLENKHFLGMFPENRNNLKCLEESIHQFNQNYMIVQGYLKDVATKLRRMCEEHKQMFAEANRYIKLQSDGRLEEVLNVAVESYVMGSVHAKVFKAISSEKTPEDVHISDKLHQLQGITGEQLGVAEEFCCPLPAAVVELARLDGINTPHEKLTCLHSTLENITEEVNIHLRENLAPGQSPQCLTSDDLLPLLVLVISQAKCRHLASNLYYLENFHWASSKHDNLGYALVTFTAAMEYIKNTDFSNMKTNNNKIKKEMSIEELMAASKFAYASTTSGDSTPTQVTYDQSSNEAPSTVEQQSTYQMKTLQMQLDNISRMMESSSISSGPTSVFGGFDGGTGSREAGAKGPPPDVIPASEHRPNRTQLGGFLAALQSDVLDCSYGKQD